MKKDEIGYLTKAGTIYIGKSGKQYVYAAPQDITIDLSKEDNLINLQGILKASNPKGTSILCNDILLKQAEKWLENANSIGLYGFKDWRLPHGDFHFDGLTSPHYRANELILLYSTAKKNNENLNLRFDCYYGSQTKSEREIDHFVKSEREIGQFVKLKCLMYDALLSQPNSSPIFFRGTKVGTARFRPVRTTKRPCL